MDAKTPHANRDEDPARYTTATRAEVLERMRVRAEALFVETMLRAAMHRHPDYTQAQRWEDAAAARGWAELAAWCADEAARAAEDLRLRGPE